jgi:hypothetical protein
MEEYPAAARLKRNLRCTPIPPRRNGDYACGCRFNSLDQEITSFSHGQSVFPVLVDNVFWHTVFQTTTGVLQVFVPDEYQPVIVPLFC